MHRQVVEQPIEPRLVFLRRALVSRRCDESDTDAAAQELLDVARELLGVRLRKVLAVGIEGLVAVEGDELEPVRRREDLRQVENVPHLILARRHVHPARERVLGVIHAKGLDECKRGVHAANRRHEPLQPRALTLAQVLCHEGLNHGHRARHRFGERIGEHKRMAQQARDEADEAV